MKKIVQIVPGYKQRDGIGNVCVARVRSLLNAGCTVTVVCNETEPAQYVQPAPTIHVLPLGIEHQSAMPEPVRAAVKAADVVILDVGGYSPLFTLAELKAGVLMVVYHAVTPPQFIRDPAYTMFYYQHLRKMRAMADQIDILTSDSQFNENEWVQTIGPVPARHQVVSLFGSTPAVTQPVLASLQNRPLNLLMVGRVFPNKNYEVAIRAIERLRARGTPATLTHIGGGGDPISHAYREQLIRLIHALKLNDCISLRGMLPQADLEAAYRACDAVILPSFHEGFSIPTIEALAFGKPVFAAEAGALPDTLGDCGLFFSPFDHTALATRMMDFFAQEPAARLAHAERGLARVNKFSEATYAKTYRDLILDGPATPPANIASAAATATAAWSLDQAMAAQVTVTPAEGFASQLPILNGSARVTGLKTPLPPRVRLTAHVLDDAGQMRLYDERPEQAWRGTPLAPEIDFTLLVPRSERPCQVTFQLVDPFNKRPDLFGEPFILTLPARTDPAKPIDQAQQLLMLMRQLADLHVELRYPTDTLAQKIKAFLAKSLTSRLQNRYLQPHVELQVEINHNLVELLNLLVCQQQSPAKS